MVPYLQIPPLRLFGSEIHAFEVLLAMSFLVGAHLAAKRAAQMGYSPVIFYDCAILCVVFGFIGAHLMHIFAYDFGAFRANPMVIFNLGAGLSSFGGFLGGGIAMWIYVRRKKLPVLTLGDITMFGLVPAFLVGRLGCYTAHDHPGRLTDFPLAVAYPGGARHDLGFYEMLVAGALTLFIYFGLSRWRLPSGAIYASTLVLYGASRFFLDFLRATDLPRSDVRYMGLTPAQYLAIGFIALGGYILVKIYRSACRTTAHQN